jgi:hypothetical protein
MEIWMNDSKIETKIKKILTYHSPIRTTKLIEILKEQHPSEIGYSNSSIYRKIERLIKDEIILEISPVYYPNYGIRESDKRAQYLVLKDADERRQHIDNILNLLETGDQADAISVFNELDRYIDRYPLNPTQLDKIVPVLYKDMDVANRAVRILRERLTRNRVAPSDKKCLLKAIKNVLTRIEEDNSEHISIEGNCLEILGIWNDPYVIVQLTKDTQNLERLKVVKNYYESVYLSKVIENERQKLFDLERMLRKKQDDEAIMKKNSAVANIISDIRSRATSLVISPPPDAHLYAMPDFGNGSDESE